MKHKKNKLLSLLLALMMLLNMLPLSVWAEGENTTPPDNSTPPQQEQQDDSNADSNDIPDDEETPSTQSTGNKTLDPSTPAVTSEGGEDEGVYTDGPWKFEVNSQGDAIIVGYDGDFENGNVNIRARLNVSDTEQCEVVMVGNDAFSERTDVVTVTVKEPLRRINAGAFSDCTALTTFVIPEESKLEYIGVSAFSGCTSLTSITIPEGIETIKENAFSGCSRLTITYLGSPSQWAEIVGDTDIGISTEKVKCEKDDPLPGWQKELDEQQKTAAIFGYNGTFTNGEVNVPSKFTDENGIEYIVRSIENDAFNGRTDVVAVTLPDRLKRIGNRAFRNCTALTSINIPVNVTKIGNDAFRGCTSLTAITLPTSVEEIGENAFAGCTSLTIINYEGTESQWNQIQLSTGENPSIPSGVTIKYSAPEWEYVVMEDGVVFLTGYTGEFEGKVTLPQQTMDGKTITHIAGQAFAERSDITELVIPEGYERINPDAFRECPNLKEIKIPLSMERIEGFVFAGCTNLEKIYYPGREDMWDDIDIAENAFLPLSMDDVKEIVTFGDPGLYTLSGTVKNSSGIPIKAATVTLTYNDESQTSTTDENGTYQFENVNYKYEYRLSAAATGYVAKNTVLQMEQDTAYDIVLFSAAEYAENIDLAHLRENEIVSFNPGMNFGVQSDRGNQFVLSNTLSGLVEPGKNGTYSLALAKTCTPNEGYTVWTFTIKDNIPWVDVNGEIVKDAGGNPVYVTAADFKTTYDWIIDPIKNPGQYESSLFIEYIKKVEVDEAQNSLTFTLKKPAENFPYLLVASNFAAFYPMSQAMIDNTGGNFDNRTMWYCGPYLLKEFAPYSYKVYEPNQYYWDNEAELFERVTVTMVDSYEEAYELFEAGQLDYVEIDGGTAQELIDNNSDYANYLVSKVLRPYSYQMHWNFNKAVRGKQIGTDENDARPVYAPDDNWNKAIANEDFRLSLYYGWELSNYYACTNPVDPLALENNTNTLVDTVYLSDGRDYAELVKDELNLGDYTGDAMVRLNLNKAKEHKEKAINALLAEGVTFPIEIDYYVRQNSVSSQETLAILRNCLIQSLGKDYVTINTHTYGGSLNREVRDQQLQSVAINGWGMDYADPYNNLAQFALTDKTDVDDGGLGYYSIHFSNSTDLEEDHPVKKLFGEYTAMLEEADAIVDSDARLAALAKAEAFLIKHGLVTPCYINVGYCIGYIDPDSMISDTMKNWELSDTLISGGEIHDDGIVDMGVWKPQSQNTYVFDWILTDDGTLYITGNGSLEGLGNNSNTPWQRYKNQIVKIVVSSGVTGLNETGAFKELENVTNVEFGEYTRLAGSSSTYDLRARSSVQTEAYSILTNIAASTFEGCTSLESIKIPESVTSIGANAFADTGLTEINYSGTKENFAEIDGCDDFLFDTYYNLKNTHEFADANGDGVVNIADVDLFYKQTQSAQ